MAAGRLLAALMPGIQRNSQPAKNPMSDDAGRL